MYLRETRKVTTMEVGSQNQPALLCLCFRHYFCCRRKRQWNPINAKKPRVKREKSVTFASKVNKVEPVRYETIHENDSHSDIEEHCVQKLPFENRVSPLKTKDQDDNSSTTALLDERFSEDSSHSSTDELEALLLQGKEAFVEKYVKDTITAAVDQWKRDVEKQNTKRTNTVEIIGYTYTGDSDEESYEYTDSSDSM